MTIKIIIVIAVRCEFPTDAWASGERERDTEISHDILLAVVSSVPFKSYKF